MRHQVSGMHPYRKATPGVGISPYWTIPVENGKSPIPEMVEYTHTPAASPPAVRWLVKLRYGILASHNVFTSSLIFSSPKKGRTSPPAKLNAQKYTATSVLLSVSLLKYSRPSVGSPYPPYAALLGHRRYLQHHPDNILFSY